MGEQEQIVEGFRMSILCCSCPPKMAGIISCSVASSLTIHSSSVSRIRCSSGSGSGSGSGSTPRFVKLAVTGVTELLRLFNFTSNNTNTNRLESASYTQKDDISVSSVDDVLYFLKCDYENAYFVTGVFTSAIYADDCLFEDPTISFRGKELYSRNLKLLVPFFDQPSIGLKNIEKGTSSEMNFVLAKWKLRGKTIGELGQKFDLKELLRLICRSSGTFISSFTIVISIKQYFKTYLKLPWKPLISIDGRTIYDLDDKFKIIRHSEEWDVSALEAIGQIFTPSLGRSIN